MSSLPPLKRRSVEPHSGSAPPATASSIAEALEFARRAGHELLTAHGGDYRFDLWFRGQGNAAYGLVPSAFRTPGGAGAPADEGGILATYQQRAASDDTLAAMFDLQHYGGRTRLLDWSDGLLTALFFATTPWPQSRNENEDDKDARGAPLDGAIFVLDPRALNADSTQHGRNVLMRNSHASAEFKARTDMALASSLADWQRLFGGDANAGHYTKPIAIFPPSTNVRLISQKGMFTLHGGKIPAENGLPAPADINAHFYRKLIIPSAAKRRIRNELKILGFDWGVVFPDNSGIVASIVHDYGNDDLGAGDDDDDDDGDDNTEKDDAAAAV